MSNKAYFPQLDLLRAVAVILVIISHWFAHDHVLNRFVSNGVLGVTLFYVLSGYLITGILLHSKRSVENGSSIKAQFWIFYMRRALRIFPVYYFLLLVLLLVRHVDLQDGFWWHFGYASNFYFWIKGAFGGALSHFWSLSVEEQFYMLWPSMVLFIPARYLQHAFMLGVLVGVGFRYAIVTEQSDIGRILMPGSLDSFCLGALLAYQRFTSSGFWGRSMLRTKPFLLPVSLLLLVASQLQPYTGFSSSVQSALGLFLMSLGFMCLIAAFVVYDESKWLNALCQLKPLLFIGKISYGVYLFHNFIPSFRGLHVDGVPAVLHFYGIQVLRFLILLGVASLSWYLLEQPLLKLKARFSYR